MDGSVKKIHLHIEMQIKQTVEYLHCIGLRRLVNAVTLCK